MQYALLIYTQGETAAERGPREMPRAVAAVLERPDVTGWVRLQPTRSAADGPSRSHRAAQGPRRPRGASHVARVPRPSPLGCRSAARTASVLRSPAGGFSIRRTAAAQMDTAAVS